MPDLPAIAPIFLAPRDVAKRLGVSVSRVAQLDREGRLPALRDSVGRRLYNPEVVERFALERERIRAEATAQISETALP